MRLPLPDRRLARLLAAIVLALACNGCEREPRVPAQTAPEASPDRWLVVNYWAEWCKPCLEEIPELNAFSRERAAHVRVLMVNYDGLRGDELRGQARQLGIEAELTEDDPAERLGFERPQVLPSTYVIDPDGRLRSTLLGPQTVASLGAAIDDAAGG